MVETAANLNAIKPPSRHPRSGTGPYWIGRQQGVGAGFLEGETMINLLIRTIELAVSTPFRAFAAIRAIPRYGFDCLDEPIHGEDR